MPPTTPSITHWSRLEPRSRTDEFDPCLRARVRDPLWMLTRQWQFAELEGDDAGSPVAVDLALERFDVSAAQDRAGVTLGPLDGTPLETLVEREPVPMDLRTRTQAGLHFARLLDRESARHRLPTFLAVAPLVSSGPRGDGAVVDEPTLRFLAGVTGRVADGGRILSAMLAGEELADLAPPDGSALPPALVIDDPAERGAVQRAGEALRAWFEATYGPDLEDAERTWNPAAFEYEFTASVQGVGDGEPALRVGEYTSGHLEWYDFDWVGPPPPPSEARESLRLLPTPVSFHGMPASRWWEFEDGITDFGAIEAGTTDLARLLVAEFGLIHGDDWFVLPLETPAGSLVRVPSLVVRDVFGESTLVQPAGTGERNAWQRFSMFSLAGDRDGELRLPLLFVPPTTAHVREGPRLEEVQILRDEMANMAWGVERTLPSGLAEPVAGFDAYIADRSERSAPPPDDARPLRYRLMSPVAENWFPFLPRRDEQADRRNALELTPILRQVGEDLVAALPRGRILAARADPYRVHDEAIPRAQRRVGRSFQRARSADGRSFLWIGRRKRAAEPEGSSGLQFDFLESRA
jgi:hypothetical protein